MARQRVRAILPDDAWIVPIAGQSPIGCVPVRSTVSAPRFTLAFTKASIDAAELPVIMARRMRPERVSRYLACLRRGFALIGIAIDDLDGPDDEDFAGIAGLEECIALAEWNFQPDRTSTTPSNGSRSGSTIDRRNFCVSSQSGLVR